MDWFKTMAGGTRGRLLSLLRRTPGTVPELAAALGITDNAVRTHIAGLERDGMVEEAGLVRATGGKPARVYAVTAGAEELFPKAYALVLTGLVAEIQAAAGPERARWLLQEVGRRVGASSASRAGETGDRVETAAEALRELGGEVEVEPLEDGWCIRGFGCPLSAVTAERPEVCSLAQALVEEITGLHVEERCDRSGRPRCAFRISGGAPLA